MQYILSKEEFDSMQSQVNDLNARLGASELHVQSLDAMVKARHSHILALETALKHEKEIADARLKAMNNLQREVQRLKNQHVGVVQNPSTGTIQVVSADKVENYLKFGWGKLTCPCGDDEFLIH